MISDRIYKINRICNYTGLAQKLNRKDAKSAKIKNFWFP